MAKLIPSIDHILKMKVPPTDGELTLLRFLDSNLDDSFEVYFNPYMNGDRPDIVIVRKRYGVLIIEVKDWDLDAYELDERKHWVLKKNVYTIVSSPIDQVLKYKENLYTLHLDELYEMRIRDYKYTKMISCAVYFHNASQAKVEEFLVKPYSADKKYQKFLANNIKLIGSDTLIKDRFDKILWNLYLLSNKESKLFSDSLYESITHFLLPTTHQKEDGKRIKYLKKQEGIIFREDRNEFVVEGVEGSGKTTVLARRAVQEYIKWKHDDYEPQILILSYNITLINFIRDKINQVQETFDWKSFTILNYHQFIGNQLNNLDVKMVLPQFRTTNDSSERNQSHEQSQYLDRHYYSNLQLFLELKNKIHSSNLSYDAILIDEMQDYKYNWFEILKIVFLKDGGDFILFGDEKQNIYANPLTGKKVRTNVIGGRMKLTQSMRSGSIIESFVTEFQKRIYAEKYDLDKFSSPDDGMLMFKPSGTITYKYLSKDFITSISDIISTIKTKVEFKDIATDDITILSFNVKVLRQLEAFYRNQTGEKLMSMFETKEVVVYINFKKEWSHHKKRERQDSSKFDVDFTANLLGLLHGRDDEEKLKRLSSIIVLDDLNRVYNGMFENRLEYICRKYGCDKIRFSELMNQNRDRLSSYLEEIMNKDYDTIRNHKKAHFYMHPGYMKISTIHSFKGWESKMIFLIIDNHVPNNQSLDELVYTGITRCKEHLYIINMNNDAYDRKLKMLIDSVNRI
ncbi:MAG: AAA family ATPase [Prevotella sp.]|nr:AAA family ATPase [Prevotella sp.]